MNIKELKEICTDAIHGPAVFEIYTHGRFHESVTPALVSKLLDVVEAASRYKELPMSDDDNRRLYLALKALGTK